MRIGVPAYFHPSWAGQDWRRLTGPEAVGRVGLIVINPGTGPGPGPDEGYTAVCAAARRSGRGLTGYLDSAYGHRPLADIAADATAYARFYGLRSVFVDQVPSGPAELPHYRRLVAVLRASGVEEVILNPGVPPDPGYRDLAEVVVEFENDWDAYRRFTSRPPGRRAHRGRARTWHLVHGVPPREVADTIGWARCAGVDYLYLTDRRLPNPWDGLPAAWPDLLGGSDGRARRE